MSTRAILNQSCAGSKSHQTSIPRIPSTPTNQRCRPTPAPAQPPTHRLTLGWRGRGNTRYEECGGESERGEEPYHVALKMGQRQGKRRHLTASDNRCSGLTSIVLPRSLGATPIGGSVTIGDGAFLGRVDLGSIVLPADLTHIGDAAFDGCSGLVSIVLPDGVSHIGNGVFKGCCGLTSIVLPEGLTHIGDCAFDGCSGLTSIMLPNGVTHIGNGVFNGCSGLTSIVLPEGVTHIGEYAFRGCSGLASIVLPESVTAVGDFSFYGCAGLTSAILPKGVSRLERGIFTGCTWLVVVQLHSRDPIDVSYDAFVRCNRLTLVVAPRPSGVVGTTIGTCPLLEGTGIVEDTAANQRRALDLQYWRVCTHQLCSAPRRRWVQTVLLVANRLRGGALALPDEMWCTILGSIRRWELGRAP
jgi:hypothetical protein